ncbi:MAG: hypothetical protein HQ592_09325 [Planctomycetes bacterium]|nr:hypothetical protein [Planctomycetota bacterium]
MNDNIPYSPTVNPHLAEFLRAGRAPHNGYPDEPFSADVRAGKGTSFYRAHTYHTKVPPQGIEAFIAHYTQPGQVVLDPFCGSGMTGIAAIRQGRRAVLSDLSPAATFFAFNHTRPVDVDAFLAAGKNIMQKVEREYGWLYATSDRWTDGKVPFNKTLWSLTLCCPACDAQYALWHAALDANRKVLTEYPCPKCGAMITKKQSKPAGMEPVRVDRGSRGIVEAAPDKHDLQLISRINDLPWPEDLWYPTNPIPAKGDEIRRLHGYGITTVDKLFTRRALLCIAALWREAGRAAPALRPSLLFAVTGIMQRASRLNKFIPSLNISPGPILGTMYIPGFYPEINIFQLFRRKLKAIARSHTDLRTGAPAGGSVCVSTQTATDLSNIPDESIDYVFTDPPFGSNIQYSELNLLWESWLGTQTDTTCEAVISKTQRKATGDYGALMAQAFAEIRRVLRPGAWLTLVFHNSSGEVWSAIQNALDAAQLHAGSVHTFDKAHDTFKMVTAPGAVGYDIVLNCRKSDVPVMRDCGEPASIAAAREFVCEFIAADPGEKSPRLLHARAIAHFMIRRRPIAFDYAEFRLIAEEQLNPPHTEKKED